MRYKKFIPPPPPYVMKAGDIAYWDGSAVKTVSLSNWSSSLGTPVGVVVIPEGFAPDGKIRLIGLKPVDKNGNQSDSHVYMTWGVYGTDTSLINYTKVPTTDNAGSTSTGSNDFGYLPSDSFTEIQSYVDPEAKYQAAITFNLIPSPYLGDTPNPEYYKEIDGGNALSDFNGFSNTQTLVGLGSDYEAANACWKYKDGSSNLQWYLPAMGELGYLMPRFNLINASLTAVGGVAVDDNYNFWSSSENSSYGVYYLFMGSGDVYRNDKDYWYYVRPFATIEIQNSDNGSGNTPTEPSEINFTIYFENGNQTFNLSTTNGYTWADFIGDDEIYIHDDFTIDSSDSNEYIYITNRVVSGRLTLNGETVKKTDVIINNATYILPYKDLGYD